MINPITIDPEIKKLLDKCVIGTYSFDENGFCNVEGDVRFGSRGFTKIPIKFGIVSGDFECFINTFTTLEGSPLEVGGSFSCNSNQLTSLVGGPRKVGGTFNCNVNPLLTLDGIPEEIGGKLICSIKVGTLPYSELFNVVDKVKGDIYYTRSGKPENKDAIRRKRDIHINLQHDELGNLDI